MKTDIIVSGLINIETTLKVDSFPLNYFPVTYPFFGIRSTISGVGYNVVKALNKLGSSAMLFSIIGNDINGDAVIDVFRSEQLSSRYIEKILNETPQSIIIYEPSGRRQIHVDLKNLQETEYPAENFIKSLKECSIAVLCNINFSRQFLKEAKIFDKLVATDVHVLSDINDSYNTDFMRYADILFLSNENIIGHEKEFIHEIASKYNNKIIICGMGKLGAMMYVRDDNYLARTPAVNTNEIVNTIGAGDALFSAFIHFYYKTKDPYFAIKKAVIFASYKIGFKGASDGFLSESELENVKVNEINI